MATRKIILINETLCNGCGDCVTDCAEGALQIVDGKAKLVREDFCDGFGDCIGICPTGALTVEEREVAGYDPEAARAHVAATRGAEGLAAFDAAAQKHSPEHADGSGRISGSPSSTGCSGSRMRVLPTVDGGVSPSSPNPPSAKGAPAFSMASQPTPSTNTASADPGTISPGNLGQWPIMLHLVQPGAPFFKDKELCVMSSCAPASMPDAQWRFVRGRGMVMACPKLDRQEGYLEKLTAILAEPSIPRAVVVRMEVPCCSGLTALAVNAAKQCGRLDIEVVEATVNLRGDLIGHKVVFGTA